MSQPAPFSERIERGLADKRVVAAVHLATLHKVRTRQRGMDQLRDVEALRSAAAAIKQHTLQRLPEYLTQFVSQVEQRGGHVHFAADGQTAAQIICGIALRSGCRLAVKGKSMTGEEIGLNDRLEAAGVRVVETDLGEFIVQIDRDRPSHIVTPIIHKDRRAVAEAMRRELGCAYTEDPAELSHIARAHLRDVFAKADLGVTGVNFAIAQTGTLCLCTNEGNGRMSTTRPRVHVALLGIEKLIPRLRDLPVFLKLLSRSSTGQPMTVYTTLISGPRQAGDPDGPEHLHVVLMDNGRSDLLGGAFESVLGCIRCGACLNACPVYRNIGGHAYGSAYPGPIGSLITPLLAGLRSHTELAGASSLCGACYQACPVKIDIPDLLVKLRERAVRDQPLSKRVGMLLWRWLMRDPARYAFGQWLLRVLTRREANGWIRRGPGPLAAWTRSRDLPVPRQTFRQLWQELNREA